MSRRSNLIAIIRTTIELTLILRVDILLILKTTELAELWHRLNTMWPSNIEAALINTSLKTLMSPIAEPPAIAALSYSTLEALQTSLVDAPAIGALWETPTSRGLTMRELTPTTTSGVTASTVAARSSDIAARELTTTTTSGLIASTKATRSPTSPPPAIVLHGTPTSNVGV